MGGLPARLDGAPMQRKRHRQAAHGGAQEEEEAEARRGLLRVLCLALAFGGFIAGLEDVGFDVSAWLFTLVALWIGGERR